MKINIWQLVIGGIIMFALMKQCEGKPRVVTNTKVDITKIIDSVKQATLKGVKPVYIDTTKSKIKWKKGETVYKESIVYRSKPSKNTINASQFEVEVVSNNATATLMITANELYDVSGVIIYPEKETTVETIITRDASGSFLYLKTDVLNTFNSGELGVFIHIKNKIGFIGEIGYDKRLESINSSGFKASVGFAINF